MFSGGIQSDQKQKMSWKHKFVQIFLYESAYENWVEFNKQITDT